MIGIYKEEGRGRREDDCFTLNFKRKKGNI